MIGESVSDILRRELHLPGSGVSTPPPAPTTPPTPPPTTVVFHIPRGTGAGAWNDGSGRVIAKVGDTLRIVNDDSLAHGSTRAADPFRTPRPLSFLVEAPISC